VKKILARVMYIYGDAMETARGATSLRNITPQHLSLPHTLKELHQNLFQVHPVAKIDRRSKTQVAAEALAGAGVDCGSRRSGLLLAAV
jgi:hypothetical protein